MKKSVIVVAYMLLLVLGISCGDMFESRKQIIGKYYLVETDTKDNVTISYKIEQGDYIGRIAPRVQEYAVIGDSLIAGKSLQAGVIQFYVINIKSDSEYAEKSSYLVGPMTENEFNSTYGKSNTVTFIKAY